MGKDATRTITVGENAVPMALHLEDGGPPTAQCLVRTGPHGQRCGRHIHGGSLRDIVLRWVDHLASGHDTSWP